MNKPKSFTAWSVFFPDGKPVFSSIRQTRRSCIQPWWPWPNMEDQGYSVRKIRCTFVTPAKLTEGRK